MMTIAKEIIIYSNEPFKKYRWISYYTAGYIGMLAANLFMVPFSTLEKKSLEADKDRYRKRKFKEGELVENYDVEHMYEPNPDFVERPPKSPLSVSEALSGEYFVTNLRDWPKIVCTAIAAGIAVPWLFSLYLRRSIHKITLLPEDRVRFDLFNTTAIGKPPQITLPLKEVSCHSTRTNPNKNYSILKIKGYRGYHLVNKRDGNFHRPELYDQHLGFERSWAVKIK